MTKYILSPQAQDRIKQIRNYTITNHGKQQNKVYMTMLRDKMRLAATNPKSEGKDRKDIKDGYYSIRAGKHNIYYRIRLDFIDVIDILHESMEPNKHI